MSEAEELNPNAPPTPSLLRQVFVRMGITMLVALVLVIAILYAGFASHLDTLRDRSLSGQAADVARHVAGDANSGLRVELPPALAEAYAEPGRYRYAVLSEGGRVLAGSPGVTGALDPAGIHLDENPRYFETLDSQTGKHYYGASIGHMQVTGRLSIQVQQSADHQDVVLDTFLDELGSEVLWIVALVFAAILLVTWFTLRASLASLTLVSGQAAAIGPETLDRRLGLEGVPAEVAPMVRAINAALERVEEGFRQQLRFTADAAHEMRTPIAVLRAHLDTLQGGQAQALGRDLMALDRVVAQLLKLAQADSFSPEPDSLADLRQVAVNVVELMAPTVIRAGRNLAVTGDEGCMVRGDADVLAVALRNLVENAARYAPKGSEVEIEVDAASCELRVLDRGPGVALENRERVFERFWRDQHNNSNGAGLGLSIVARIAAAHHAEVRVREREGGGAVFVISFPRMESSSR